MNTSKFVTRDPKYPDRSLYLAKIDYRKRQSMFQSISSLYYAGNNADPNFNTNINYIVNDKVRLSSQFSLMSPMGGVNPYSQNGLNGSKIYYDTSVDYKPTDNMLIKFSMNNYPRYYRNPYSRFLMTR